MPKCNECKYLRYEGYEYPEYYCEIFGLDTPDKYITKDGEGCRCTKKFLERLHKEVNKSMEEELWYDKKRIKRKNI